MEEMALVGFTLPDTAGGGGRRDRQVRRYHTVQSVTSVTELSQEVAHVMARASHPTAESRDIKDWSGSREASRSYVQLMSLLFRI
jgi:hypothetical protein